MTVKFGTNVLRHAVARIRFKFYLGELVRIMVMNAINQ